MIYKYECGNCESTPCACEPPDDWWSPAEELKDFGVSLPAINK